jgi:hypothetical protein
MHEELERGYSPWQRRYALAEAKSSRPSRFGDGRRRAVGGRFGTDSIRETPRLSRRIPGFIVSVGQQTPPALALGILDWFYR